MTRRCYETDPVKAKRIRAEWREREVARRREDERPAAHEFELAALRERRERGDVPGLVRKAEER